MVAFISGKHSLSRQFLKRIASGFEIEEAHIFIIWIDISWHPHGYKDIKDYKDYKVVMRISWIERL